MTRTRSSHVEHERRSVTGSWSRVRFEAASIVRVRRGRRVGRGNTGAYICKRRADARARGSPGATPSLRPPHPVKAKGKRDGNPIPIGAIAYAFKTTLDPTDTVGPQTRPRSSPGSTCGPYSPRGTPLPQKTGAVAHACHLRAQTRVVQDVARLAVYTENAEPRGCARKAAVRT